MATRRRTRVKSPIPKWHKPPVDTPIQALREFIAKHGHDVAVLTTWTHESGDYQFTTIGSDQLYADTAVNLRNLIAVGLDLHPLDPVIKDLRGDHPNISLSQPQIDFLLWVFGRLFAEKDKFHADSRHRAYISKYHDEILPLLAAAKSVLKNKPT